MEIVVNVHDLKTHYSKYLDKVMGGEEVVIGKHGKPVAKIVPISNYNMPRKPGGLKGKIWVSDDFDEPLNSLWETFKNKG